MDNELTDSLNSNKTPADNTYTIVNTVFADLVTFIMMLFILLFVLIYNEDKTEDFITQFQVRFGDKQAEQQQSVSAEAVLVSRIEHFITEEKLAEYAQVVVDEHRIRLILNPPILFRSGEAALLKGGLTVLKRVSSVFSQVENPLVVEGHTDNVPINNENFGSNWELSFYRAFSVIKYFVYKLNYDPNRLSALGYGEYRPIADNNTAVQRAKNRRIEINVIRLTEKK